MITIIILLAYFVAQFIRRRIRLNTIVKVALNNKQF